MFTVEVRPAASMGRPPVRDRVCASPAALPAKKPLVNLIGLATVRSAPTGVSTAGVALLKTTCPVPKGPETSVVPEGWLLDPIRITGWPADWNVVVPE